MRTSPSGTADTLRSGKMTSFRRYRGSHARPTRTKSRIVVAIPVFCALFLGGAAVAEAHGGDQARIHACVTTRTGALRVVDASATCAKGESALDWNQQGLQGVSGPAGAKGDPGVPGDRGPSGAGFTRLEDLAGKPCETANDVEGIVSLAPGSGYEVKVLCSPSPSTTFTTISYHDSNTAPNPQVGIAIPGLVDETPNHLGQWSKDFPASSGPTTVTFYIDPSDEWAGSWRWSVMTGDTVTGCDEGPNSVRCTVHTDATRVVTGFLA